MAKKKRSSKRSTQAAVSPSPLVDLEGQPGVQQGGRSPRGSKHTSSRSPRRSTKTPVQRVGTVQEMKDIASNGVGCFKFMKTFIMNFGLPINDIVTDWIFFVVLLALYNAYSVYNQDDELKELLDVDDSFQKIRICLVASALSSAWGTGYVLNLLYKTFMARERMPMNQRSWIVAAMAVSPKLDTASEAARRAATMKLVGSIFEDGVQIFLALYTLQWVGSKTDTVAILNLASSAVSVWVIWFGFFRQIISKRYLKPENSCCTRLGAGFCIVFGAPFFILIIAVPIAIFAVQIPDLCTSDSAFVGDSISTQYDGMQGCSSFYGVLAFKEEGDGRAGVRFDGITNFHPLYVIISGNANLQTIDIRNVEKYSGSVAIRSNPRLESFTLAPQIGAPLQFVGTQGSDGTIDVDDRRENLLVIEDNAALTSVSFEGNHMFTVPFRLFIRRNAALTAISMNEFDFNSGGELMIEDNDALPELLVQGDLDGSEDVSMTFRDNAAMTNLTVSRIVWTAQGYRLTMQVSNMGELDTFDAGLESLHNKEMVLRDLDVLSTLDVSQIDFLRNAVVTLDNLGLTTIDFAGLVEVDADSTLTIQRMSSLTTVTLPLSAAQFNGVVAVTSSSSVTTINLPAMTTAQINTAILNDRLSFTGLSTSCTFVGSDGSVSCAE